MGGGVNWLLEDMIGPNGSTSLRRGRVISGVVIDGNITSSDLVMQSRRNHLIQGEVEVSDCNVTRNV